MRDIDWSVVTSGLGFLESAVEHLAEGSRRDLCYAALHLSTAIETLLKTQLARQDWKLVFENMSGADRKKYESGDFKSVGIRDAVRRLGMESRSCITKQERERIDAVADLRNRVAHFALYGKASDRAATILAHGLDALLQLIDREFLPAASNAERERIEATLDQVGEQFGTIDALIAERMERLRPALPVHRVLSCPRCILPAYVLGDGKPGRCEFCLYCRKGEVAAADYLADGNRLSYYGRVRDSAWEPVENCATCSRTAFLSIDVEGGESFWACFACGYTCGYWEVDNCLFCEGLTSSKIDDLPVCERCTPKYYAE